MSIFNKQTKQETIIYTLLWSLIFLSPIVDLIFHYENQSEFFVKRSLIDIYGSLVSFLVLFIIHNRCLAPLLLNHKKTRLYLIGTVAVFSLFIFGHCMLKPSEPPREQMTMMDPPPAPPGGVHPPIDRRDWSIFMIAMLMIGANLGLKYYFKNEEEKKHLAKLKEQSLKQELDYLRYQVNPHFIMNTLNNIHALVDIDPEQAKDSIVDLSRMLRYSLYESNKPYVPLNQAVTFLKKHLNLMKLRYTDTVTVNFNTPRECSDDVVVAPLLFLPFVENAFKHGVSLDKPSTIDIDVECREGRLLFRCHNTKSGVKHEYGGVGLNNVSKRLELIYGNDYSLDITDGDETYDVLLNLPAKTPENFNRKEQ